MDLARKRLPSGIASEVLSFPIPKELQSAECKTVPQDRLRVGFVGRPILIKGIHVLIAAVERAHSLIPLELHMFCPRNDDEQSEYWRPLRDRVRCLEGSIWSECGVFDVSALRAIHSTIDALALPSIWPDFFPFVTLEAQALGTPVLLSDFPSQRELFNENQNTAWFVAPGDVDAWVNCLLSVWDAKRHGSLGRPVCRAPTLDQYAQTLLSTYERARRPFQIARATASAYDA
jgi:glycosyltransferase involved in cell wall biosynthesis